MDYKGSVLCADSPVVLTGFAFCSQLQPGDCLVGPVLFPCARVPITPYEEVMNAPIVTDQPVEEERKHQSLVLSCLSFAKTNLRSTTNNV